MEVWIQTRMQSWDISRPMIISKKSWPLFQYDHGRKLVRSSNRNVEHYMQWCLSVHLARFIDCQIRFAVYWLSKSGGSKQEIRFFWRLMHEQISIVYHWSRFHKHYVMHWDVHWLRIGVYYVLSKRIVPDAYAWDYGFFCRLYRKWRRWCDMVYSSSTLLLFYYGCMLMSCFICISIFPEIYDSFVTTSLIGKARDKWLIAIHTVNPRDFCHDKHRQVDDTVYGWGVGMLLKAEPLIQAIEHSITTWTDGKNFRVCMVKPSPQVFTQHTAIAWAQEDVPTIFVSGRYEWIDHRVSLWWIQTYPDQWHEVSIGQFVLLGWEVASMCMMESVIRLIPWIIGDYTSTQSESYSSDLHTLEYPQYTKPSHVRWFDVPPVLLSWHHHNIEDWKQKNRSQTA